MSVLVLLHLAAVALPPLNFASRSGPGQESPLARSLLAVFRPYVEAAYLDHGYFYFAPNPGASHLVRYRVEAGQGRGGETHVFPDLNEQQPRLLYHRHFMLAEWLGAHFTPPTLPEPSPNPELRATQLQAWKRQRALYEEMRRSFERRLESVYDRPVSIVRLEHRPPAPQEALSGLPLSHPSLYRELSETTPDSTEQGSTGPNVRGPVAPNSISPGPIAPGPLAPRRMPPYPLRPGAAP